jgi:hypothetical protein
LKREKNKINFNTDSMRNKFMKNSTLLVSVGLAAGLLAAPAYSAIEDCRGNLESYSKMKNEEQRQHAFIARNSNKGKGNGGEAIDVIFELTTDGPPVPIDCYSTEDEEMGGTTYLLMDGDLVGSQPLHEFDPGKGNQPPPAP